MQVATHGGRADNLEAGVGGGDCVDHSLGRRAAVEEVAPSEGGVGLRIVDDKGGAVGAAAYPVEDVAEGDGGVDGVGRRGAGVGVRVGGGGGGGEGEHTRGTDFHHVAVSHSLRAIGASIAAVDSVAPVAG